MRRENVIAVVVASLLEEIDKRRVDKSLGQ